MVSTNKIKRLLSKYYNGITTIQDEEILFNYFQSDNVDDEFTAHKVEFLYFLKERHIKPVFDLNKIAMLNILDSNTEQIKKSRKVWFQYAAVFAGFLISISTAYEMGNSISHQKFYNSEIINLKSEINEIKSQYALNLMNQQFSLSRVKAVNMVAQFDNIDDKLLDEIVNVLRYDVNENVRLAALEVLTSFIANERVKIQMIQSIPYQSSAVVVYDMFNIPEMTNTLETKEYWMKLLAKPNLDSKIKENIQNLL